MNRKHFLDIIFKSILFIGSIPLMGFAKPFYKSSDELTGKSRPKLVGRGYRLRPEASVAFKKMKIAAKKKGFNIKVVSSYRNYQSQRRVWHRKYINSKLQGLSDDEAIEKIIEYSTIPGTSRHHWGTDLDIIDTSRGIPSNSLEAEHFVKGGKFYKFKLWLNQNAESYGFYEVYTNDKERKGFKYEPWHFSYKPLSVNYLKEYRGLDLFEILKEIPLHESKHLSKKFVKKYLKEYILGINPELL